MFRLPTDWLYPVLVVLTIGSLMTASGIYGYHKRSNEVAAERAEETKVRQEQEILLLNKMRGQEANHQVEVLRLTGDLRNAEKKYEEVLRTVKRDYDNRLLQSKARSSVYERQASAGTFECRSLGSHTTELDRTLEEGRYLVEELRATLELRENQLIQLGNQISADRKVLNNE